MFSPIIWLGFNKWWKKRNNIQEIIKKHVDQWAKEFFCWYNPPYWHNKFGFEVSPNGRFAEHEQITDFESLKEVIQEVHKYGKKIMWNVNHWYYTDVVEKEFKQMIDDFIQAGIDGFIVSSMWTLEYLEEISEWKWEKWYIINGKRLQLNISTIMAVYNIDAIEFLKENYPIAKVILSREVTLPEIEKILEHFPDLLFEVFGEWDFCRYNNWLCFAEHKYTDRDICTLVVNNWIRKKAIRYDFRKLIWDKNLENNEKVAKLDNEYKDEFQQIDELIEEYLADENNEILNKLANLIKVIVWKYILFYDPLQGPRTKHNENFLLVLDAVKLLKEKDIKLDDLVYFENLDNLLNYLLEEEKAWKKQYIENMKEFIWWKFGIQTKFKDNFYNRADNLNLYSYVFFDKFKNIDTVKFPTRWRNYLPKIQLIAECVENPDKIIDHLDMNVSPERAHYSLKYLFNNNKYWFYDLRKKLHNK
jgi:collagenase-like PrtC family protease